jgi:5-methylcytosine-specific restriction endonuclease McrA
VAPDVALEVDHVVPRANGGTNDIENLAAACVECNAGKSDGGAAE